MTNNLNVAEWIIVGILCATLFILLILSIVLVVKLIKLSNQAKKVVETGQSVADKVDDVVGNVRDITATGSMAKGLFADFASNILSGRKKRK